MNLLAIETSSEACSVAVSRAGEYFYRYEFAPQQHASLLMPMIEHVMADSGLKAKQLTGLAYGHGPGSFTGVRIAAGTLQGIALGLNLKVAGISTLQALAHRAWREYGHEKVIAAFDARMHEVYLGAYETHSNGNTSAVIEDKVGNPELIEIPGQSDWTGFGSGWNACNAALSKRGENFYSVIQADLLPHALDVIILAEACFRNNRAQNADQAMPVYLRDKVALTEKERWALKAAKLEQKD